MKFADSVKQSASLTSTATITLGAAATGFRTLAQAITDTAGKPEQVAVGDLIGMRVEDVADASKWEISLHTITGPAALTRQSIVSSSAAGAAVTFGGSVTVLCTVPAVHLVRLPEVRDIAFAQSVPLTQPGSSYMPQTTVAGALTFTPAAAAVRGALVYLRLVADGTNTPSFAAFKEWGGSSGYDNRNGIVNEVQFFYDGYDYWFSASQAVGAVPVDMAAPTASSAAVANATPSTVSIAASEALDANNVPAASAFAVTGHTVLSVAISGASINLTVSAAFANGEAARTVNYVQPGTSGVRDLAGNLMASFGTPLAITNNVQPVDTTAPTVSGAQVANATPTVIQITMSETLANSIPAAGAFSVSGGKTVSGASIAGAVLSLTCSAAYVNGDTITVSYTQPGANPRLQDAAGNATISFGPVSVTNNVGAAATAPGAPTIGTATAGDTTASFPFTAPASNGGASIDTYQLTVYNASTNAVVGTFSGTTSPINATGLTDGTSYYGKIAAHNTVGYGAQSAASNSVTPAAASATVPVFGSLANVTRTGDTYTGAGGSAFSAASGMCITKFQNGVDGSIDVKVVTKRPGSAYPEFILGVTSSPTAVAYQSLPYAFYAPTFGGTYKVINNGGVANAAAATVSIADNDIMRVERVGSTLNLRVSSNSGSFVTIHSWAGVPTTALYIEMLFSDQFSVTPVASSGLA